jgi:hypothetical protein
MKQLLWAMICMCLGHKLYQVDEGSNPTYRRKKCARCSYKTEAYPIETIGPFTIRVPEHEQSQRFPANG